MSSMKIAIVCEGKDISYGYSLLHLLRYKNENEVFTCNMLGDISVELYSAEAFRHADISKGTIEIFVNHVQIPETSYTNVFQRFGMDIFQLETAYVLRADEKQLTGAEYERFIAYANAKRKEYFALEKQYTDRVGACDADWISKEFKQKSSNGLLGKKKEKLQQQYDCLAYVLYSDFLRK